VLLEKIESCSSDFPLTVDSSFQNLLYIQTISVNFTQFSPELNYHFTTSEVIFASTLTQLEIISEET